MEQKVRYYRMRPDLSLVDERAIFRTDEKPFCIYDQNHAVFHYCDVDDFQVCCYLRQWRSEAELHALISTNTLFQGHDVAAYVDVFKKMGLLEETDSTASVHRDAHEQAVLFTADPIAVADDAQRPRGFPTSISLNVTTACNLRCRHCSQDAGSERRPPKHLPLDVVFSLFDQFEKCALWDLRLSGGEPTCYPDLAPVLHEAARRRFGVTLFTNGTVLTPVLREAIVAVARAKATFRVHLSVDGARPETHDWLRNRPGVFDKLTSFMRFLREDDVTWIAECVVTRRNVNELADITAMAAEYGARVITFHACSMVGRAVQGTEDLLLSIPEMQRLQEVGDDLAMRYAEKIFVNPANVTLPDSMVLSERLFRKRTLALLLQKQSLNHQDHEVDRLAALNNSPPYKYARKHEHCTAGVSQMAIEGDGFVYACPYLATRPDWSVGNVLEQDILSIWKSKKLLFFRGGWDYSDLPVCRQCARQKECRLPKICRVAPLLTYNNLYGPAPECVLKYKQLDSQLPDELWESLAKQLS